jgi:hypothetical protein
MDDTVSSHPSSRRGGEGSSDGGLVDPNDTVDMSIDIDTSDLQQGSVPSSAIVTTTSRGVSFSPSASVIDQTMSSTSIKATPKSSGRDSIFTPRSAANTSAAYQGDISSEREILPQRQRPEAPQRSPQRMDETDMMQDIMQNTAAEDALRLSSPSRLNQKNGNKSVNVSSNNATVKSNNETKVSNGAFQKNVNLLTQRLYTVASKSQKPHFELGHRRKPSSPSESTAKQRVKYEGIGAHSQQQVAGNVNKRSFSDSVSSGSDPTKKSFKRVVRIMMDELRARYRKKSFNQTLSFTLQGCTTVRISNRS